MSENKALSGRLADRLLRRASDRADSAKRVDAEMHSRLGLRHRFLATAIPLHGKALRPGLELVADAFPHSALTHGRGTTSVSSLLRVDRASQMPATVTLHMGLELDEARESAAATYSVDVVPMLVSREHAASIPFDLVEPDHEAVRVWADERLMDFVELCLAIEAAPEYQRLPRRIDPVCGMAVVERNAVVLTDDGGRDEGIWFCSDACRQEYAGNQGASAPG